MRRQAKSERRYLTIGCPQEVNFYLFLTSRYSTAICANYLIFIQVTQTEIRDPLRERQNLVQRWQLVFIFRYMASCLGNQLVTFRSASDQTPGGQSKVLRKRLQSEDQVRRLPGTSMKHHLKKYAMPIEL